MMKLVYKLLKLIAICKRVFLMHYMLMFQVKSFSSTLA